MRLLRPLSPMQSRVVWRLREGRSRSDTAKDLGISISTVKHHIEGAIMRLPPAFLPDTTPCTRLALFAATYPAEVDAA